MQDTVVLYPYPGRGHIISMVELGKLLLRHHNDKFSITILLITSDFWDNPSTISYVNSISHSYPSISFHRLPPFSVIINPSKSRLAAAFAAVSDNKSHVLHALKQISQTNNIYAFVIDIFCGSVLDEAKNLKFPTYYFFTSGAACLCSFLYFPKLQEKHHQSFKDLAHTLLDFPANPPLKALHMPEPMLDRDDPSYNDIVFFCHMLSQADGLIVNTFDDLEPKAVKTLASGVCVPDGPTPSTYCIGPLISAPESGSEVRHECLLWLDKQPRNSVVFLCFGSRGSVSKEQLKEIANGLERSGRKFLWVVKNSSEIGKTNQTDDRSDFELENVLPEGFVKRVEDRGVVVKSWAPQIPVLSHESVGGFVTHCGWNSVLEAVVAGVPMVAWPLYAEQHLNRNILVEDMKIAIPVEQRDNDGFVTGDEVEKRVRELMESETGQELRERILMLKDKSMDTWTPSGSSVKAVHKLLQKWQSNC